MKRWYMRCSGLLATAVLLLSGPAAEAATVRQIDPAGDAPARHDFTVVTVRNSSRQLCVTARVPGLQAGGRQAFGANVHPVRTNTYYYLRTNIWGPRQTANVNAWLLDGSGVRISKARGEWAFTISGSWVKVCIWQSQLKYHRTVRIETIIGTPLRGEPSDSTRSILVPFN